MQWRALALVAGLVLSLEASAQAEDVAAGPSGSGNFGGVGQVVISSDFQGSMGYSSGTEAFFIALNPSVDYFLKENLSLGGSVTLATTISDGSDLLAVGLRVRGGYNVWLSEKVSVWPQLGLGVGHTNLGDNTYLEIAFTAPFLVHLATWAAISKQPLTIHEQLNSQLGCLAPSCHLGVTALSLGYFISSLRASIRHPMKAVLRAATQIWR